MLFAALGFFLVVGLASYSYLASEGFATFSKNAVAVVTVQGVIEDASDIVRSLDGSPKNDGVRAVVLRVDSPGGGVAPSQEIYGAVERVRERKPIVASLGRRGGLRAATTSPAPATRSSPIPARSPARSA